MNKFDITELPKQWLVALVALAFTFLLVSRACHSLNRSRTAMLSSMPLMVSTPSLMAI